MKDIVKDEDKFKNNFIEFVSSATPQELSEFISKKGKKARLKKYMFRI